MNLPNNSPADIDKLTRDLRAGNRAALARATWSRRKAIPHGTPNNFGISEISLDGEVETGILRFGPVPNEGRFAIVTDVRNGMRWTLMALLTNGA